MSHAHSHDNMIPPGAVRLAAGLCIAVLLLVMAVRGNLLPSAPTAAELRDKAQLQPVAERTLRFADVAGAVQVTDARTGATVASFGQEGSGFIRGVMRGLARERRMHGVGAEPPFRLALYPDTELVLTDTATGRVIELSGFGTTNRAAFASLLERRP